MKKVIISRGLPASGKTTWAKKKMAANQGSYKRVNKDDLRAMLDDSKWSKHNEKFVLRLRDHIILEALEDGKHVIVDDTNLHPRHETRIRQILRGRDDVRVVIQYFNADPKECIARDLKRENSVGSKVIMDMYNQFVLKKVDNVIEKIEGLPSAIICDIDGTLAHMKGRSPYDWSRVGEDEVDWTIRSLLACLPEKVRIILVTGRDGSCESETREWLKENKIRFNGLFIRSEGNMEKDYVVKQRIFDDHIRGKYNVEFVLDDRKQVVDMWREIGLKCFQVAEGNF